MDTKQTMGERLRSRREALALTQRDLSSRAGVATDVIVKLEHDARKPRPSTVRRVAEGLGVPAEYLTSGHVGFKPIKQGPGSKENGEPRSGEVRVAGTGEPNEAAIGLLDSWDTEDPDYDQETLPELQRNIDADRPSYRKLYS